EQDAAARSVEALYVARIDPVRGHAHVRAGCDPAQDRPLGGRHDDVESGMRTPASLRAPEQPRLEAEVAAPYRGPLLPCAAQQQLGFDVVVSEHDRQPIERVQRIDQIET